MNSDQLSGHRELEHTADWKVEVWAPDLPGLLTQAAKSMYSLIGIQFSAKKRTEYNLRIFFTDYENLLVDFLNELLYLLESQRLGFDTFEINTQGKFIEGKLSGTMVTNQKKEIKAVTYHNLNIEKTIQGLKVTIVFDV